jgi:hypothetical protein
MPFLSKMIWFWRNLFCRRQLERDLDDELQGYLEEMAERKIQEGLTPEVARESSLRELGGLDRIKSLVRQQRIGLRGLRPAAVTVIVAAVAFGAGGVVGARKWKNQEIRGASVGGPSTAPSSNEDLPTLSGRVIDKTTGVPIPNMEVGLRPAPDMRRYTFTDSEGRFSFINPPETPYRLEAGKQRWSISESGTAIRSIPRPPKDFFEFLAPSDVIVRNTDGQLSEGERVEFHGRGFNGKPYPPAGKDIRRFSYSTSVVELQAENLTPGRSSLTSH